MAKIRTPAAQQEGYLRKERELGMKLGTAQHRLRVKITFWLVVKCGMTECYRCGLPIENEFDLSIDHKEPWVGVSSDLYWDLSNIAFSHKSCNYAEHRVEIDRTKMARFLRRDEGPEGTAWCYLHRDYLPKDNFSPRRTRWSGVESICRECRSKQRSPGALEKKSRARQTVSHLTANEAHVGNDVTGSDSPALGQV